MSVKIGTRLDYVFVLRPMLFFPGWSTMLAGYLISYRYDLFFLVPVDYLKLFLLLASFAMMMGSTFILNQLMDIESDRENKKLFLISEGHLTRKAALTEALILAAMALVIGLFIKPVIAAWFLLFFILTGLLYNLAPFSLKDRPWGSLFANAFMGWIAFAIGWSSVFELSLRILADSLPYVLFNTSLYLFTILPDVKGDELGGKRTLAVKFGPPRVIISAFLLFAAGLVYVIMVIDVQALLFYLLSVPFYIRAVISRNTGDTVRATKFGILFFALSICLKIPAYLGLMVCGFYLTRLYFRSRFGLVYPNFSGK